MRYRCFFVLKSWNAESLGKKNKIREQVILVIFLFLTKEMCCANFISVLVKYI